jgi:hypothetical protein
LEFLKIRDRRKAKNVASRSRPIALQQAAIFLVTITDKAAKLVLHLSPLSDAQPQRCTARSAPTQQCPQGSDEIHLAESHDGEERFEREQ